MSQNAVAETVEKTHTIEFVSEALVVLVTDLAVEDLELPPLGLTVKSVCAICETDVLLW